MFNLLKVIRNRERGITLIEMLVVMVLIALVAGLFGGILTRYI